MSLSTKEAAALVGMTKQGIIRAIHKGKLSATRNDKGEFMIDPVELFRVYEPVSIAVNADNKVDDNETENQSESLRVKVEMLERIIRDKDAELATRDRTIEELLARLAAQQQITLQLEDKQQRVSWWRRLFGSAP